MNLTDRQKAILRGVLKDRLHFAELPWSPDGMSREALGGYRLKIEDAKRGLVGMNAGDWLEHIPTASERVLLSADYRVLESLGLIERHNLGGNSTRTTHLKLTSTGEATARGLAERSPSMTETGIPCANCGSSDNKVLRTTASAGYIVRRRECASCGARITTTEREIHTPPATGSGLVQISIGQIRASLDLLADLASGTSAEAQN